MYSIRKRSYGHFVCWAAFAVISGSVQGNPSVAKPSFKFHQEIWRRTEGLPQNTVPTVVQSRTGYIWMGTELGLVRFDGSRFLTFNKSNTQELQSNVIDSLLEDRQGTLWIGTIGGGLTKLRNGQFQTFTVHEGLSADSVRALLEDRNGDIWIGTDSAGLNRFHNGQITAYRTTEGLPDNGIYALAQDRDGAIWVGTHNGLSRFWGGVFRNYGKSEGLTNTYIRSLSVGKNAVWVGTNEGLCKWAGGLVTCFGPKDGLPLLPIPSIHEDANGTVWIATIGAGLNRLDGSGFKAYTSKDGLPTNDIWTVFEGRDHSLWIGTGGGGLVRLSTDPLFTTFDHKDGLSNDVVLPVFQDHEGTMWIGTKDGGLNRYRDGQFSAFTTKDGLANNHVFSIAEDRDHNLWIGTRNGLNKFSNGKFTTYHQSDGLPSEVISAAFVDSNSTLWLGTRAGLTALENGKFRTYTTENGLPSNTVRMIHEDRKHHLWIGTTHGLALFENGKFRSYTSHDGLSSNVVLAIHDDSDGAIWIGTNGGGLDRFKNGQFTTYTIRNGLFDDAVFRVLEDDAGNLWMSSDRGVFRVSKQQLNDFADGKINRIESVSYGEPDGLNTAECNGNFQPAGWKSRDGRLWFPTMQGVSVVDPRRMAAEPRSQTVSVDAVYINGHQVSQSGAVLPPGDGDLTFDYSVPNFRAPQRVTFRYRLLGFDHNWVNAGTARSAHYTNIPPGHYGFEVAATNGEGVWSSTTTSFEIELQPHFYQTKSFLLLCFLTFGGLIAAVHFERIRGLREREKDLARKVGERTHALTAEIAERTRTEKELLQAKEAAEQANRFKSEFLAHMSHEIRTPMNGILGMTELALATESKADQQNYLVIARNSAESLLTLINEILDFSKVEAGKLELDLVDVDLRESLAGTIATMTIRAQQKGLRLIYNVNPGVPAAVRADPIRLNQVVSNLLSNAIKFTAEGEIELYIRRQSRDVSGVHLHFTVRDTGIGVPQEQIESIFEVFSQAQRSTTRQFGGTGLGLAICRRLVHLMGGEIWAESTVGQGSEFHFTITCQEAAPNATISSDSSNVKARWTQAKLAIPKAESLHILVAEDNPANRMVARANLEQAGFQVTEVENGVSALDAIKRFPFDAVLMDCRMPVMDGYAATRLIRELPGPVGQVPIIALTASAFREDREKAKQAGMNDFIAKPFHSWELVAKCVQWIKAKPMPHERRNGNGPSAKSPTAIAQDLAFRTEMMELFVSTAPGVFAQLVLAVEDQHWEQVRSFAHWLQGGATRMVNPELQQRLKDVESKCRHEAPSINAEQLQALVAAFEQAMAAAQDELRQRSAFSAVS